MRTKEFSVPTEFIAEFAESLDDSGLNNSISGVNEDGEIMITVTYEKKERTSVFELMEILDTYKEEQQDNEEEEEDEDD